MNLAGIATGDLVWCNVGGRFFYARAAAPAEPGRLAVEPLSGGISYRSVPARHVVGHFKALASTRDPRPGDLVYCAVEGENDYARVEVPALGRRRTGVVGLKAESGAPARPAEVLTLYRRMGRKRTREAGREYASAPS